MERIVATYGHQGHEINVVEVVDEDETWYHLVVRNVVIDGDESFSAIPTEEAARASLERWLERSGLDESTS
jgi:hypothetical protein